MIDTQDLSSYYPGYEDYLEPKKEFDPDEDDCDVDAIVDEMILRRLEEKEND